MAPAPERTADESGGGERSKLLYVMGAGRSGSTILGVTLGNCEGVFYAGELDKWLAHSGTPMLPGAERARFWSAVRAQVDEQGLFAARTRLLERSSALLRPRAWRERVRLRARYRAATDELIAAIARCAGAACVVDSSHYPLRARELQRLESSELHLLLLVRDPQGVVASLARKDVPERSFGTLAANAYLWLTLLLCIWVFRRQPRERRLLVRYEDLVADPRGVTEAILRHAGISASAPADLGHLRTGPIFHANRLARSETVALEGAQASAARGSSLATTLLQWPLRLLLARLGPSALASK